MLKASGVFICSIGVGLRRVVKVVFWLGPVLIEVINPLCLSLIPPESQLWDPSDYGLS